ncbi:MAG: 3'(2'),5'-bisphosphate nucleotidase [Anaerolineales bacterium]|nr:3'(2'),5'-bisphosphate nucleotidase [Anaerolineales bacterium]
MIDLNNPEVKFALHAVRQACQVVQHVQADMVSPALTKEDRSPVTVADFASQAVVAWLLTQDFPEDPLVAEENAEALRQPSGRQMLELVTHYIAQFTPQATPESVCDWVDKGATEPGPRFWCLDPIDGTKGFLRGDQYAVALALLVEGKVQLGVLGCPNLTDAYRPDICGTGSLVIASRSQGTWVTPLDYPGEFSPLHVSERVKPSNARVLRSFESRHTNITQIDEFVQIMGVRAEPIRMDSQAKYAVLASGKGDLLLRLLSTSQPDYREKIWDQAAGSIILEEAGGRITDILGKELDFNQGRTLAKNRGICASNKHLHRTALKTLDAIGAWSGD